MCSSDLSQKAVNAYRREHPGSKLKTAVTEKNPKGKRASRRKSFCSRMGGMKKRLTSAKTARDPDSRINKALRRWNCEESFNLRLAQLREERMNEGVGDYIEQGRQYLHNKVKDSPLFHAAQELSHHMPGYPNAQAAKKKWAAGDKWGAAKEVGKSLVKAGATGAAAAATYALKTAVDSKISGESGSPESTKSEPVKFSNYQVKRYSGFSKKQDDNSIANTKYRQKLMAPEKPVKENKIVDIRNMISEGTDNMDLEINGRTITLNTSMAKRILEVYDSVNTKNKKIVESMINEDLESFKKLLNFSIKV